MASTEVLYAYYPPEEVDRNIVGHVQLITAEKRRTIRSTFLGEPFGEDKVIKGRIFVEQRAQHAAHVAIQNMQFRAEGQLGYSPPDEVYDSLTI